MWPRSGFLLNCAVTVSTIVYHPLFCQWNNCWMEDYVLSNVYPVTGILWVSSVDFSGCRIFSIFLQGINFIVMGRGRGEWWCQLSVCRRNTRRSKKGLLTCWQRATFGFVLEGAELLDIIKVQTRRTTIQVRITINTLF